MLLLNAITGSTNEGHDSYGYKKQTAHLVSPRPAHQYSRRGADGSYSVTVRPSLAHVNVATPLVRSEMSVKPV